MTTFITVCAHLPVSTCLLPSQFSALDQYPSGRDSSVYFCSAWLKLNHKLGMYHPTTTPPPHPTTTNFSATYRRARKLKFCTDAHYAKLIQLTNCHCDICPGNICLGDICPYQEYLSSYWSNFHQTLKPFQAEHFRLSLVSSFCFLSSVKHFSTAFHLSGKVIYICDFSLGC